MRVGRRGGAGATSVPVKTGSPDPLTRGSPGVLTLAKDAGSSPELLTFVSAVISEAWREDGKFLPRTSHPRIPRRSHPDAPGVITLEQNKVNEISSLKDSLMLFKGVPWLTFPHNNSRAFPRSSHLR